jgi:hypothetical protein
LPLIILFCFCQQPQLAVPFRLQCVRDESVPGIHLHVPSLRQTGFVTGSLDLGLSQAIGFVDPFLDFVLDRQCYFQRDR